MRRNHNTRRIIGVRPYDFNEVANLFGVHVRTVQRWHKLGMVVVDETSRPFLVVGNELRRFVTKQKNDVKHKLLENEFFCVKCRAGRKVKPGSMTTESTGKRVGKNSQQIILRGICESCGTKLCRFTTDKKEYHHDN